MQFETFSGQDECKDCCPECTAQQPASGEPCGRCGRTAVECIADWSDCNYIFGSPVKREEGFDRLLTVYDRLLLQFGMHISWQHRQLGNNLPPVQRSEGDHR